MAQRVDLLIRGGLVITMNSRRRVIADGEIAIREGYIVAVGTELDVEASQIINATGCAVLPGLVNAHTHETLTRGLCEDLPLDRWLEEICFPLDRSYTPEVMRAAALLNQLEMIKGGTTTFLDIYRFPAAAAEVAEESGLRAIFAPQIMETPAGVGETIEAAAAFVEAWRDRNPRVHAWFGPHAPYTVSPEGYRRVWDLAEKYDVGVHTHLAETRWEVEQLWEQYGCTPVEHLERLGLLGPRLTVAHGVHLSQRDIELLRDRDVAVVYNPTSNMKLASGVAPVPDLLAAGVRVGLGTDSNLSNNNLDMFEEMRMGALLQKLHRKDAAAMSCGEMLAMATIGGARALSLADEIGSLEVGKKADLIVVNLEQPHLWPLFDDELLNVVEHLVYSANAADVTHTIVDGQVLMADRRVLTLDEAAVYREVQTAARELVARAAVRALSTVPP
ncbi:MAG TPA: amidohydrolase [Anaerolineae bacterium]|nr:amidohydrolase [Anaerolineae bacterium]